MNSLCASMGWLGAPLHLGSIVCLVLGISLSTVAARESIELFKLPQRPPSEPRTDPAIIRITGSTLDGIAQGEEPVLKMGEGGSAATFQVMFPEGGLSAPFTLKCEVRLDGNGSFKMSVVGGERPLRDTPEIGFNLGHSGHMNIIGSSDTRSRVDGMTEPTWVPAEIKVVPASRSFSITVGTNPPQEFPWPEGFESPRLLMLAFVSGQFSAPALVRGFRLNRD